MTEVNAAIPLSLVFGPATRPTYPDVYGRAQNRRIRELQIEEATQDLAQRQKAKAVFQEYLGRGASTIDGPQGQAPPGAVQGQSLSDVATPLDPVRDPAQFGQQYLRDIGRAAGPEAYFAEQERQQAQLTAALDADIKASTLAGKNFDQGIQELEYGIELLAKATDQDSWAQSRRLYAQLAGPEVLEGIPEIYDPAMKTYLQNQAIPVLEQMKMAREDAKIRRDTAQQVLEDRRKTPEAQAEVARQKSQATLPDRATLAALRKTGQTLFVDKDGNVVLSSEDAAGGVIDKIEQRKIREQGTSLRAAYRPLVRLRDALLTNTEAFGRAAKGKLGLANIGRTMQGLGRVLSGAVQPDTPQDKQAAKALALLRNPTADISAGAYLLQVATVAQAIANNPSGRISDRDMIVAQEMIAGSTEPEDVFPRLEEALQTIEDNYADLMSQSGDTLPGLGGVPRGKVSRGDPTTLSDEELLQRLNQ